MEQFQKSIPQALEKHSLTDKYSNLLDTSKLLPTSPKLATKSHPNILTITPKTKPNGTHGETTQQNPISASNDALNTLSTLVDGPSNGSAGSADLEMTSSPEKEDLEESFTSPDSSPTKTSPSKRGRRKRQLDSVELEDTGEEPESSETIVKRRGRKKRIVVEEEDNVRQTRSGRKLSKSDENEAEEEEEVEEVDDKGEQKPATRGRGKRGRPKKING